MNNYLLALCFGKNQMGCKHTLYTNMKQVYI